VGEVVRVAIAASAAATFVTAVAAFMSIGLEVTVLPAIAFAALPPFLTPRALAVLGCRGRVYASLVPLVFVPLIAARSHSDVSAMSVLVPWRYDTNSSGALWLVATLLMLPVGTLVMVLFGRLVTRADVHTMAVRARIAGRTMLAIAGAIALMSAIRLFTRTPHHQWLGTKPIVASFGDAWVEEATDQYGLISPSMMAQVRRATRLYRASTSHGGAIARCSWNASYCEHFSLLPGGQHPVGPVHVGPLANAYRIRQDAAHGLYVVEAQPYVAWPSAFDSLGRSTAIPVTRVHDDIAPPTRWTVVAVAGFFVAAALLVTGRRRRRALSKVRWIEGRAIEHGVAQLEDGTRIIADFDLGTRVVAACIEHRTETFRTSRPGHAGVIREGTRRDVEDDIRTVEAAYDAWAASVAILTATPAAVFVAFALVS
jgi:hypothetical protein